MYRENPRINGEEIVLVPSNILVNYISIKEKKVKHFNEQAFHNACVSPVLKCRGRI